jgi:hypothetical protein
VSSYQLVKRNPIFHQKGISALYILKRGKRGGVIFGNGEWRVNNGGWAKLWGAFRRKGWIRFYKFAVGWGFIPVEVLDEYI